MTLRPGAQNSRVATTPASDCVSLTTYSTTFRLEANEQADGKADLPANQLTTRWVAELGRVFKCRARQAGSGKVRRSLGSVT